MTSWRIPPCGVVSACLHLRRHLVIVPGVDGSEPRDATADALLDAALWSLGERGLRGATTRGIAERAGVNEVTLFRRFGSKSALIRAAIERQFEGLQAQSMRYTGDIEADLADLAREYRRALEVAGPAARVLLTEVASHPELAESVDVARRLFGSIAELLARYQAEGLLRPEPAAALIPAFLGPIAMPLLLPDLRVTTEGLPGAPFDPRTHVLRFLYGRAATHPSTQGLLS